MTTFLLIRHAAHDLLGRRLAGRMPGVSLNDEGRQQAVRLAERLAGAPIHAVISGPLERARETAEPLAQQLGLPVRISAVLDEIDFGEWTGLPFTELDQDPRWRWFNTFRSGARAPGGELMSEVQTRVVAELARLREELPEGLVALVSHGDVIKAAVAYFLGVPLDLFQRIEISPASVSVVELAEWGPRVVRVNDTGELLGNG